MNDLRFAFRQLLKSPGFTCVAVLTLALGIGATTAIVSVVHTAVFDPLPARHPERLVQLGHVDKERGWSHGINPAALGEARQQTNLFARIVAYNWEGLNLPGEDFPQPVPGLSVTPEFFSFWNLRPLLGRTFTADEGQAAKNNVMVISYRLWHTQFGGDPAIIGRSVSFRERPMTVVGVMPPHFSFPEAYPLYRSEYWRPVEGPAPGTDEYLPNTHVIAEMLPGIAMSQVQAFLDVVTQRQGRLFLQGQPSWFPFQVREVQEMFSTREVRRALGLLLGAIVFVLLIAAANVANLQLARTETRQQELAVRAALGASRARVFRQLFTESVLLAAVGGVASLVLTAFGLRLFESLIPAALPRLKPISLNLAVLGVTAGVTLTTGLLFGLAPAWQGWRVDVSEALKLASASSTRGWRRGRFSRTLMIGQLALVLVLLSGAGLMVRSVANLLRVNPNLEPQRVVRVYPHVIGLLQRNFHPDPLLNRATDAAFAFFADARRRLAAIPGVVATGVGFEGREMDAFTAPGTLPLRVQKQWIGVEQDDPLRVLRVPLRQGRWLERGDAAAGIHSVLVNETAARQFWPGEAAVGKRFRAKERDREALSHEVVGVVGDTRDYGRYIEPQPTFYRALAKEPGIDTAPMFLIVRAAVNPHTLYQPIGKALKAAGADPRLPSFLNLQDMLQTLMAGHRIVMLYLTIFAGVGSLLAAIGLYGVLSYSVARRTREIGIRMAMGAQFADIRRLILGQGLGLAAAGGVIGLIVSLATGRLLRAYLFGVASTDMMTFVTTALFLAAVALLACWLPARRAASVDPMEALRYE